MARDELYVVQDELRIKDMTLSRVNQEASEAMSSVERLTEECHGLHGDLQRQEALVSQKEGVIAELRDETCTLWASRWLAFWHKATKVFPGLDLRVAGGELRVVEDELWAIRDELQVARDELYVVRDKLRIKATTLSRVS